VRVGDAMQVADVGRFAGRPAFEHLEENDRLGLIDFEERRGMNVDTDEHGARVIGRSVL
jgi:hypothetical protein